MEQEPHTRQRGSDTSLRSRRPIGISGIKRSGAAPIVLIMTAIMALGPSCETDAERRKNDEVLLAKVRQAQQRVIEDAKQAEAQALEQAKLDLRKSPEKHLIAGDLQYYDKGIINEYRQLTKMSVLNRSKFAVTRLAGEVDWFDDNGGKIGSTNFSLRGSIPVGETKWFSTDDGSLKSGTLGGSSKKLGVRFTQLEVIE